MRDKIAVTIRYLGFFIMKGIKLRTITVIPIAIFEFIILSPA